MFQPNWMKIVDGERFQEARPTAPSRKKAKLGAYAMERYLTTWFFEPSKDRADYCLGCSLLYSMLPVRKVENKTPCGCLNQCLVSSYQLQLDRMNTVVCESI